MTKAVRVYTQHWNADEYHAAVEHGDTPDPVDTDGELYEIPLHADNLGDWNQDETQWIPADDVTTAAHLLSGHATGFWASECSDSAAEIGPGAWYEDEPYHDPHTGEVTAKSARLEGDWTVEQARAIRDRVLRR